MHQMPAGAPVATKTTRRSPRLSRLRPVTVAIGIVVLVVTLVLSALTQLVNHGSNQRLLRLQVRQAASVVSAALPSIQTELEDGLQVAQATGSPAAFSRFMAQRVGAHGFASVSLWRRTGQSVTQLALVGSSPALVTDGRAQSFLGSATRSAELHVVGMLEGTAADRLGYAEVPTGSSTLIVYAESSIPAQHHLSVPRNSAFSDLNFALYLGPKADPSQLIEASAPVPLHGLKASSTLAFGDTWITVVGTPTTQLAGGLSSSLPWIVLAIGVVLTAAAAALAEYVLRRRERAEQLARDNERLYLEQRSIALNFQHALLPDLPRIERLEAGARYIPGTAGLDVGGDWYDLIQTGPRSCTFVLGDVSGHGLQAATTMAALRFATRAYAADGTEPAALLRKLGRLPEFDEDAFATVLVGTLDLVTGSVTLASAGHPPPLVAVNGAAHFIPVPATVPIGVGDPEPETATICLEPGSVLVAFTDGLVERRGEPIDAGMQRLRDLDLAAGSSVEQMIDRLVAALVPSAAHDDTALLALRWAG